MCRPFWGRTARPAGSRAPRTTWNRSTFCPKYIHTYRDNRKNYSLLCHLKAWHTSACLEDSPAQVKSTVALDEAEVAYFDVEVAVQQEVLQLEVTMSDVLIVQVSGRVTYLHIFRLCSSTYTSLCINIQLSYKIVCFTVLMDARILS